MESGFGVGRYRGDVVANMGAGFASFFAAGRGGDLRRNSFLRTMNPFRDVLASACLFKDRSTPQETSAARDGGFCQ